MSLWILPSNRLAWKSEDIRQISSAQTRDSRGSTASSSPWYWWKRAERHDERVRPTWFSVHMLKAVDADGRDYYKVGRTRSSCLSARFHQYQGELLAVEPRLSLVCALDVCLMSSDFHAKRFEGRIHKLMLVQKPELLLGAREKTREIYTSAALPYLTGLFVETSAMTKDDFLNELAQGKLKTSVFSGGAEGIPDDDTTEAAETDPE